MDITWLGHSCFRLKGKEAVVIVDPYPPELGYTLNNPQADILALTHCHANHSYAQGITGNPKKISGPGEYEIAGIFVTGIASFHDKAQGQELGKNTIYHIAIDDVAICHLGDLGHELDEKMIQLIGKIDILFIPVGGNYTIDAEQAWRVIDSLKPKITIPMHYRVEGLSIPVAGVEPFLEKNNYKILKVGNEIDIEKDELPKEPEVWVFTL